MFGVLMQVNNLILSIDCKRIQRYPLSMIFLIERTFLHFVITYLHLIVSNGLWKNINGRNQ